MLSLLGGGGVDGAIHKAAGPKLLSECRTLNGCETGHCKITKAYNIRYAKHIIHAVGPRWMDKGASELLWNCYYESLQSAAQYDCHSIAFPCISTGVFGMDLNLASKQALDAINKWLEDNPDYDITVYICCFRDEEFETYSRLMQ